MDKRYKHILVPLDGSELAELALADAFALARLIQAEVTLLQVIPPIEDIIKIDDRHAFSLDEQFQLSKGRVFQYFHAICQRVGYESLTIHLAVEMGHVAETIIDYAKQHLVDLIIMATHGRSGLSRWAYGSVADKVLRAADVPVLLVRARAKPPAERIGETPQ
jgi:nucleotide-binding universal stress UspA family protein